jgi:hypothetical protein
MNGWYCTDCFYWLVCVSSAVASAAPVAAVAVAGVYWGASWLAVVFMLTPLARASRAHWPGPP